MNCDVDDAYFMPFDDGVPLADVITDRIYLDHFLWGDRKKTHSACLLATDVSLIFQNYCLFITVALSHDNSLLMSQRAKSRRKLSYSTFHMDVKLIRDATFFA